MLAVIEDTGELHVLFSTERTYNSDYKWYKQYFGDEAVPPAFDLKYHNDFIGCIGYLLKKQETKVLSCIKISQQQVDAGKERYQRGLRRQRVRTYLANYRIIHPRQFEAALGAYMAETESDQATSIRELARDGFVFAGSGGCDLTGLYSDLYRRDTALQKVHDGDQT